MQGQERSSYTLSGMRYKICLLLLLFILSLPITSFSPAFAVTTHYYWINMSQGYSSNIDRAPKPLDREEYITHLGGGFSAQRIEKKWNLNLTYNPIIRYFKTEESTDFIYSLSSAFVYADQFTKTSSFGLQVSDNISRQKKIERGTEGLKDWTPVNTLVVIPSSTSSLSKNTALTSTLQLTKVNSFSREKQDYLTYGIVENLNHSFSPRLSSSLSLSYNMVDWERSEDSNSLQGNLNLSYQISPLTTIAAGSGYAQRKTEETKKKVSTTTYQASIEKKFKYSTIVFLSSNRAISDDKDIGYIRIYDRVSGTVNHTLNERNTVTITSYTEKRDYKLADLEEELWGASVTWRRSLTQYLFLGLSGSFDRLDYIGPRIDESSRLGGMLSYQLAQTLFASLDYNYREKNSNDPNFEYVENTIFINMRWASGKLPGAFPYFGEGEVR